MVKKDITSFAVTKDLIGKIGGDYAVELVRICEKKGRPVTDEEIEKKIKLKITEIRAVLNRLHYRGIASYNKKRNPKTGWYAYTWMINPKRIAELVCEKQQDEILRLEKKLEFEANYVIFSCKKLCRGQPFEIAAEYNFRCPECGETLEAQDNEKAGKELKKTISTMKNELIELRNIT
jgi:transcription initiation factor TFIIE subunit alpha